MKKLLIALFALFVSFTSFAQATKFGYINSMELLSLMPEAKKANAELETLTKTYEDQIKKMSQELETKYKAFTAEEKTMTDAIKEVKAGELESLNQRIQSLQQSAQEKIGTKKDELFEPILRKADAAIKDVAKANGYTYIFDANSNALLYAPEADNIIGLVKKYLNIKDEPTPVKPATNNGGPKAPAPKPAGNR
jgi:outer membrane protein